MITKAINGKLYEVERISACSKCALNMRYDSEAGKRVSCKSECKEFGVGSYFRPLYQDVKEESK